MMNARDDNMVIQRLVPLLASEEILSSVFHIFSRFSALLNLDFFFGKKNS